MSFPKVERALSTCVAPPDIHQDDRVSWPARKAHMKLSERTGLSRQRERERKKGRKKTFEQEGLREKNFIDTMSE